MTNDRDDLIELLATYALIADTRAFEELFASTFTDPVGLDFTSIGSPLSPAVSLDAWVRSSTVNFEVFEATHHAITSPRVAIHGDRATVGAHARVEHWFRAEFIDTAGPNCWLLVGLYSNEAVRTPDGWRFSKVKLTATHQENADLFRTALAAAKDKRSRA